MTALVVSLPALAFVAWLGWAGAVLERREHRRMRGDDTE